MIRLALTAVALLAPTILQAQAISCAVPGAAQRVRPDLPTPGQPKRLLPIGGYTLALTWTPEFCRTRAAASFQCGGGNRFGFTLHGLWPDGVGKD